MEEKLQHGEAPAKAEMKGCYDELHCADLLDHLAEPWLPEVALCCLVACR